MNRKIVSARIASFVVIAAVAIEIIYLCWSPDFDALSFLLYITPIIVVIFVGLAVWAGTTRVLGRPIGLLVVYLVVTLSVGATVFVRSEIRWWLARGIWKQRILEQPEVAGQLKHLDWDGWGFIGQDTEVYLVYDPADHLRTESGTSHAMQGAGLPCDVSKIRRLEPHWYSVTFYTDTTWDSCP